MVKILSVSKGDGINPRTVRIPRFPAFYSKVIDDEMREFAEKYDVEIVRIIYDDHFFGYGFLKGDELLD
ncbi:MAG: hypothetical protein J6Y78_04675 [Paludibacteraceae bacterium]|nr:hypothetical protein [Paludibacteraceae bacterium]